MASRRFPHLAPFCTLGRPGPLPGHASDAAKTIIDTLKQTTAHVKGRGHLCWDLVFRLEWQFDKRFRPGDGPLIYPGDLTLPSAPAWASREVRLPENLPGDGVDVLLDK